MRRAFALIFPLAWAVVGSAPFPAASAAPSKAAPAIKSPAAATSSVMTIEAKTTEYDGQKHTYTVTGDVRIDLEDMRVTCRQATIFATADDSRVERVLFVGDVVAKRGANVFTGEKVTLTLQNRRLMAEGGTTTRLMVPASTPSAR